MSPPNQAREDTRLGSVLVLEDDWLIALDVAGLLEEAGYLVVGPAASVGLALDLIRQTHIDIALLDINVKEERSYPVARALDAKGVPFAFLSGYVAEDIDPEFRNRVLLNKPFSPDLLLATLAGMLPATV